MIKIMHAPLVFLPALPNAPMYSSCTVHTSCNITVTDKRNGKDPCAILYRHKQTLKLSDYVWLSAGLENRRDSTHSPALKRREPSQRGLI